MKKLKVVFMDGQERIFDCERYWHQHDKGILGIKQNGTWHSFPDRNVREYHEVTSNHFSSDPEEKF